MDLDHVPDYCINRNMIDIAKLLREPKRLFRFISYEYIKYKPLCKVYKPLHNIELLIPILLLYALGIWNSIATGALIGFIIHLGMDFVTVGHIGSISLIYKIRNGFPKGSDLVKRRLSRIGRDICKCQMCGAYGETTITSKGKWFIGFSKKALNQVKIICLKCHEQMYCDKD